MQFTARQKRQFIEDGYIVIRGAVPRVMVDAARHAINHDLGQSGMNQDQLPNFRSVTYCPEVTKAPEIYRLFNDTPIFPLCESLIGTGKVLKRHTAQRPSPARRTPRRNWCRKRRGRQLHSRLHRARDDLSFQCPKPQQR
jgi:hypothetical protein